MSILKKIFSPKGEFNRKEYLIYGFIVPIIIVSFAIGIIIISQGVNDIIVTFFAICVVIVTYIILNATIKRANNTVSSTLLILIIWFLLTPISVLYLLFAPAKAVDNSGEQKKQLNIMGVIAIIFFGIVVLGMVSAVVFSKFVKYHDSQKIEQQTQNTTIIDSQNQ